MSLIRKHASTQEGKEARRRNGRQSHGAATPEGKERSREGHLRHGIYAAGRDQALRALGEDPAQLAELLEGSYAQWRPANGQQSGVVEQLAHLQWRMFRAVRVQENLLSGRLQAMDAERRRKVDAEYARYVGKMEQLGGLQRDALRPDFYAPPGYIQGYMRVFAGELQEERLAAILDLLQRLQEPDDLPAATAPLPAGASSDDDWQEALCAYASGDDGPLPDPELPVAEGEERAELREELRLIAQLEETWARCSWDPFFAENRRPMTTAERDKAAVEFDPALDRVRREEDACVRKFCRMGTLLMKMQDRERQQAERTGFETGDPRRGSGGNPPAGGWAAPSEAGPNGVRPPSPTPKNEGSSGDIIESKGSAVTNSPEPKRSIPPLDDENASRSVPGTVHPAAATTEAADGQPSRTAKQRENPLPDAGQPSAAGQRAA